METNLAVIKQRLEAERRKKAILEAAKSVVKSWNLNNAKGK